jgi:hypothetical protein
MLPGSAALLDIVLASILVTVASILTWLAAISGCAKERIYFALCASSATFGLLRTLFGDLALPSAQYLRVGMLSSAVVVGASIFRSYACLPEGALPDRTTPQEPIVSAPTSATPKPPVP